MLQNLKQRFGFARKKFLLLAVTVVPGHPPEVFIKKLRLEETRDDKKSLIMNSPQAEFYKAEQILRAESPNTFFYQENGSVIELNSVEAVANMDTKDVIFNGPTDVKSPEGFLVQGRNLEYSNRDRKLTTPESIQFQSTPQFKSAFVQGWGTGFEADLQAKTFYIAKDFNVSFLPKEPGGSPSKLRGDNARIFNERGWARVEGNVAFQNKDLSLRSDYLSVSFDAKAVKEVEEAIFQSANHSHVVAVFDSYKLSSNEVTLLMKNRKTVVSIVAKGDVIIADSAGLEMSTDRLEILDPQNKARKMALSGNVNIKRGTDQAKCKEASFDPVTDDLILKGDASFQRGSDLLAGQEILYSKNKGTLEIRGATGQLQKSHVLPKKN